MTHILRFHTEIGKMPVVLDPCPWPRLACRWPWPELACPRPWPRKNFKVFGLDFKVLGLTTTLMAECVVDWVALGGRVCLLKLRLQKQSLCILQVYVPNIELQYEALLEEVEVALGKATSSEYLVLLGDFNAHVGIDNATW